MFSYNDFIKITSYPIKARKYYLFANWLDIWVS
jgi:hypothetical protein